MWRFVNCKQYVGRISFKKIVLLNIRPKPDNFDLIILRIGISFFALCDFRSSQVGINDPHRPIGENDTLGQESLSTKQNGVQNGSLQPACRSDDDRSNQLR
jgi:hypothetical protein